MAAAIDSHCEMHKRAYMYLLKRLKKKKIIREGVCVC